MPAPETSFIKTYLRIEEIWGKIQAIAEAVYRRGQKNPRDLVTRMSFSVETGDLEICAAY